jgi:hypothetical protein
MKKTISIGLLTVGVVLLFGAMSAMKKSHSSVGKKLNEFLFDDINDFPIGI